MNPIPQTAQRCRGGQGPRQAGLIVLLALALGACSAPVVSPELMPKARFTNAQLQAMGSDEIQSRRDALAQQRTQATANHEQAEKDCWQRFAVTSCINQSAQTRRAIHDQLRADDIALEDEQRRRRLLRANERLQTKQLQPSNELK